MHPLDELPTSCSELTAAYPQVILTNHGTVAQCDRMQFVRSDSLGNWNWPSLYISATLEHLETANHCLLSVLVFGCPESLVRAWKQARGWPFAHAAKSLVAWKHFFTPLEDLAEVILSSLCYVSNGAEIQTPSLSPSWSKACPR